MADCGEKLDNEDPVGEVETIHVTSDNEKLNINSLKKL